MRKLCSIQQISQLVPIPDKDRVEFAKLKNLGWQVMVKKDEFAVGDTVVYCEVDTVLDSENSNLAFLEKFKWRVKALKVNTPLGPMYSEGLILPLSTFPQIQSIGANVKNLIDLDVTELINATKYELPQPVVLSGDAISGGFIPSVPKTDETRLASCLGCLQELSMEQYYISLKYDGTSLTCGWHNNQEFLCSRNMRINPTGRTVYAEMRQKYHLDEITKEHKLIIQGEVFGDGIQKNPHGLKGRDFVVFNIYKIMDPLTETVRFLSLTEMIEVCTLTKLKYAHILEVGMNFAYTYEDLVKKSMIKYENGKPGEGIVVRPVFPKYSTTLKSRLSFKQINPEYLV